jgi:hypothetical protein
VETTTTVVEMAAKTVAKATNSGTRRRAVACPLVGPPPLRPLLHQVVIVLPLGFTGTKVKAAVSLITIHPMITLLLSAGRAGSGVPWSSSAVQRVLLPLITPLIPLRLLVMTMEATTEVITADTTAGTTVDTTINVP